jgi:integrase
MSTPELGLTTITAPAAGSDAFPSYFPAETVVSRDVEGYPVSSYADPSWDFRSASTDGISARTLHFFGVEGAAEPSRASRIRAQHKALMWVYIDAGKARAVATIQQANYALFAWGGKADRRGVDLFTMLTNSEWVAEDSTSINSSYLQMTPVLVRTLWRHREALSVEASSFQLGSMRQSIMGELNGRPEHRQTPLIPSRVYCSILAGLVERMDVIDRELDDLLGAFHRSMAAVRSVPAGASKQQRATLHAKALKDLVGAMRNQGYEPSPGNALDRFIIGRLVEHQIALMLTVSAFSGMRKAEVAILPLADSLHEFEHLGATHYELHGFTHKLNNGQKTPTSWITSHQGARAARLAERIAWGIVAETGQAPKAGQQALLFPSTRNPYRRKANSAFDIGLVRLRELVCPMIARPDIDELDRLELARDWQRDDIEVGKRWPLAFHQLRRSLAVYAHRSGMVTLPALKAQLQHISEEMTSYYAYGYSRATNLVFDRDHFSHEWNAAKEESSYFGYTLALLLSDEDFFGGVSAQRMSAVVESRSREDTLRLFREKKLAYRETVLGGCVSTEECKAQPLEPIPYDCLESSCPNMVVLSKRLRAVLHSQQTVVATLARCEPGSVEHRLEVRHLEVLLNAQTRLEGGK